MRTILFFSFVFCTLVLHGQELGVRFGEMDGNNIGIDGTIPIKDKRIHGTVSFGDNVGVDVIYDFLVAPMIRNTGFHYYVGVGLTSMFAGDLRLGVAGELGFEYRFNSIPVAVSLDYRPSILVVEEMDFLYGNFGFSARYVFR